MFHVKHPFFKNTDMKYAQVNVLLVAYFLLNF